MISLLLLTAPDRSAEAEFVKMLEDCARLSKVQISISKGTRDRDGDALQADALWYISLSKPNTFRVSLGDYWGSEFPTYISDGKTLLQAGTLNVLQKAPANLIGAFPRGNGAYAPLFDFMRGKAALDMVAPDGDIVRKGSVLKVETKDLGDLEINLLEMNGLKLPTIVDVRNIAARMASYRLFPMFSERPEDPLEKYSFTYKFVGSFPKNEFSTAVPKGQPVEDKRKKG